ncbi:hypothetical protein [Treponema pedis]|uniref:Uncharacterized protein n=1 Tax=Treponema pedis TaxID=409322 RepID=A0A7S6WN86_9SPIR|nr:hypothetical protein [Treponema pedis]QOW60192.1 hypothetical protein IFE08_10155 [Treponema pedis]
MGFFMGALIFFIAMILTLAFTIFLYIHLVIAVKNNRDVPKWMYKIGHALKGRGTDIYKDFTDKSALNEVNSYIIGVVIADIAAYFIFYGKYFVNNKIAFWLWTEFLIVIVMSIVISFGKCLLSFIFPAIKKTNYNCDFSAAANAVMGMILMSIFACALTLTVTGLPVKAPVVQVGEYKIIVGHTKANDLLSNGFSFSGKAPNDIIENKRESHFVFGETVELVKDGKGYGYVNLTPRYQDKARIKDCIITYFGITSKSRMIDDVKICDKSISELSLDYFEKENVRDVFSLSPISYQENKVKGHYSLVMQTYPYMLWKSYTIEVIFFGDDRPNQFEVYARHTLWE